jgi:hypothetical protein
MKKNSIILLVIIGIGLILRLWGWWDFPLMRDEISAISRLHFDSFSDLIEKGIIGDPHPAGIQVFLWLWAKVFGMSEIALRLPSLLMGISCIPLMYIVAKKWFNETAGLFAATFVAVSQYTIIYSLILRPYAIGLFFILLLIIIWTKIVFKRDYRWKNFIILGFLAAICAYVHHFSMLTAFLIAFAGLFLIKKQGIWKYLVACLIAILLYIPHIPIILAHINLGITEQETWLEAPKPRFSSYYIQYLFHFSWIAAAAIAIAMILSSKISRIRWNENKTKIGVALLLFITTFATGYIYSHKINPVLQFSGLIFAFPFLLLIAVSFIDSKINIRKIASLLLICIAMIYTLVVTREHYKFLPLQWFEKSVSKSIEWIAKQGEKNVDCILNTNRAFISYYEEKMKTPLNIIEIEGLDDFSILQKVATLQSNYMIVAGLTDVQIEIIKHFYPVLVEYIPCYTSEIYVFAKEGKGIEGMQKINTEEYTWDIPILDSYEFIPIKECNLQDICPSRFTKILLTFDYQCDTVPFDYALVLQTSYKGTITDWRCVKPNDFYIKNGDMYRSFLPFRYELLVKDSKRISHYSVKIFIWNMNKTNIVHPVKCSISTYKSNPYIYGMVENLR